MPASVPVLSRPQMERGIQVKPDAGEIVYYRRLSDFERHSAEVAASTDNDITLSIQAGSMPDMTKDRYFVISDSEGDYHVEVLEAAGDLLKMKRLWAERREYFRVDAVFPLKVRVVSEAEIGQSGILSGYAETMYDTGLPEPPDPSVNPRLWKMLADMNVKINLIMEKLCIEDEGMMSSGNRHVNLSASGIRFSAGEHCKVGDLVELKMLLPASPPLGLIIYGRVVRIKDMDHGEKEIAVSFVDMDDEVREEIIRFNIRRQRDMLRIQRRESGEGPA